MKWWTSPHDVYTAGLYTKAGTPFLTDAPKGAGWVKAADPAKRGDKSESK